MSNEQYPDFKIGIVGPTRVGKTSLIASILSDSQRLLAGSAMKIRSYQRATEGKLAQHHKELEGSLRAGEFNPGALSGTEEPFTFKLLLDSGTGSDGILFSLLDYPGGWIDPNRRPAERDRDWETCKEWLEESSILIVPVESAVIMEAASAKEKNAVPHILETYQIAQILREWAKERAKSPKEPAFLIFCPVKCESYFADNGGGKDHSAKLFNAVKDYYQDVFAAVRGELPQLQILYAPVDTIGCVEIISGKWLNTNGSYTDYSFSANYRVRDPGRQTVKGADSVMIAICRHMVGIRMDAEAVAFSGKDSQARVLEEYASRDEGIIRNIGLFMFGGRKEREEQAAASRKQADNHKLVVDGVAGLQKTIAQLAGRDLGSRTHKM